MKSATLPELSPLTDSSAAATPDNEQTQMATTRAHVSHSTTHESFGGSVENNNFRSFKVLATDKEAFLACWADNSFGNDILLRDDTGTLTLRISSADISDRSDMHVGHLKKPSHRAQWLLLYDQHGVSRLIRPAHANPDQSPNKTRDQVDQPVTTNSNLGRYGPSGLTVKEFVERRMHEKITHALVAKL